jgi:hypothetical protein
VSWCPTSRVERTRCFQLASLARGADRPGVTHH